MGGGVMGPGSEGEGRGPEAGPPAVAESGTVRYSTAGAAAESAGGAVPAGRAGGAEPALAQPHGNRCGRRRASMISVFNMLVLNCLYCCAVIRSSFGQGVI